MIATKQAEKCGRKDRKVRRCRLLKIGKKEIQEILILTDDDELIASITDENIIVSDGCKVVCVPNEN